MLPKSGNIYQSFTKEEQEAVMAECRMQEMA